MNAETLSHPAAALFPLLNEWDLQDLADDIKKRGQREPIALYKEQVLDGRNRLAACNLVGVEPTFRVLQDSDIGGDPIGFVISCNLRRRHMNVSQLAMVGAELKNLYAKEAYARMNSGKANPRAGLPQGKSRDQAARVLGIGGRSVQKAEGVQGRGCQALCDAVKAGDITVNAADEFVRRVVDKDEQAAIVTKALATANPGKALGLSISGGTTFDVAEIEAYVPPERKRKNGSPVVSTNDRKDAVTTLDKLIRILHRVGLYERHMQALSTIREDLSSPTGVTGAA